MEITTDTKTWSVDWARTSYGQEGREILQSADLSECDSTFTDYWRTMVRGDL